MGLRNKVLEGLECCARRKDTDVDYCNKCPYFSGCSTEFGAFAELASDALALLKAQEPRVMTLEEVKSLERDTVVWYEHTGVNKQRPRIVDQVYDSGIIFTDGWHWQFNADAYGKKFRLWASRPTEAEREAVKWE